MVIENNLQRQEYGLAAPGFAPSAVGPDAKSHLDALRKHADELQKADKGRKAGTPIHHQYLAAQLRVYAYEGLVQAATDGRSKGEVERLGNEYASYTAADLNWAPTVKNVPDPDRVRGRHHGLDVGEFSFLVKNYCKQAGKPIPSPQQIRFLYAVYSMGAVAAEQRGQSFSLGIPEAELSTVEGFQVRASAAQPLRDLLKEARLQLRQAINSGRVPLSSFPPDVQALYKTNPTAALQQLIGVSSGYRSLQKDFGLWMDRIIPEMAKVESPLNQKAAAGIVRRMSGSKATPGYSNHTDGKGGTAAIDFYTFGKDGKPLKHTTKDGYNQNWKDSWFCNTFMKEYGSKHGWTELASEGWHQSHNPRGPITPRPSIRRQRSPNA